MSATDRNEMIEQLRAMIAGRGDGIDLDTPFHWAVAGLKQPEPFFQHLPSLLPPDSILYVEGITIVAEVAALYSAHRAPNAVDVARDTIAPAPDIYHFQFSTEVANRLGEFAGRHSVAEMFNHFKAYRGETVLLSWHDAFDNPLRISERIAEETVARFSETLGVSYRREQTGWRDPELLRKVLWSLEHPEQPVLDSERESWFRRIWRRLKAR
jgi:hypothetical protein